MKTVLQYFKRSWIIYSLLVAYFLLLFLEAIGYPLWLPSCPISSLTGKQCMGCGMNHAFIDLISGDFEEAYHHNKLIFIWVPLILGTITFDYIKFLKPTKTKLNYE